MADNMNNMNNMNTNQNYQNLDGTVNPGESPESWEQGNVNKTPMEKVSETVTNAIDWAKESAQKVAEGAKTAMERVIPGKG